MRSFILAAVAATAAIGAVQHGHFPIDLTQAVGPRDGSCSELPRLCTSGVMMYGYATTLTYLCPEKAEASATTVKVTSTMLLTVTVELQGSAPPHDAKAQEPTTTTKTTTTVTEDRFITIHGRGNPGTNLAPPVITDWFSQGTPPPALTPPVITTSFSQGVPPKKMAGMINKGADVNPPLSLTPPVITDWFSQGDPPKMEATSLTPPVITDWFSQGKPPAIQTGYHIVKHEHENHTTSTNATGTNITHIVPTPTGMSGQIAVSFGALVFGLIAAACFI